MIAAANATIAAAAPLLEFGAVALGGVALAKRVRTLMLLCSEGRELGRGVVTGVDADRARTKVHVLQNLLPAPSSTVEKFHAFVVTDRAVCGARAHREATYLGQPSSALGRAALPT